MDFSVVEVAEIRAFIMSSTERIKLSKKVKQDELRTVRDEDEWLKILKMKNEMTKTRLENKFLPPSWLVVAAQSGFLFSVSKNQHFN